MSPSGAFEQAWEKAIGRPTGLLAKRGVERKQYYALLGSGIARLFAELSGGKRWIDSTNLNTLVGEQLGLLLPNAQFLHIIRDGRWVVNSMLNSGFKSGWAKDFRIACETWVAFVAAGEKCCEVLGDRVLEIRHEALVDEPARTMQEAQQFLGVEYCESSAAFIRNCRINSSYATETVDLRKRRLESWYPRKPWTSWTPVQRATFQELAGSTMVEQGYDLSLE